MRTYQPKAKEVKRKWHLIDAKGEILGRMATKIATLLTGKHKPSYANHMDMGDYVVIVNASQVEVTGRKRKQKVYRKHSGYPGGFKEVKFEKLIEERPERVVQHAVSGMLPKNRLHKKRMVRLKVFAESKHQYQDKFKSKN
ncbi:50S ribosomal protein L13 [Candidatus Woesebacteria bacterium RIFCSPHIGHO2_01_FULL_38_10]|uniref:Large ribosomal subunit protein uL13 n=1 Tax=Candidatus Woesebacteria bacterium RIFCSPLOWO2_01_FULL_39_10b TaxID=1802517 RepID=A0A1F8B4I9_9BACT|nr:MAG: 50S ribosomal protein L13 [Candidatus Woesebacteria bacterium RIFCSPHIGHO2_01_FULL_38_10]OGM58946.1 MAG: 50S ribosomal protein L13 [Candidatus Woesebacteria bacterium RIFCSPLOWO2_01_FULL_39_10b]